MCARASSLANYDGVFSSRGELETARTSKAYRARVEGALEAFVAWTHNLDINFVELREGFQRYRPLGLLIAGVLLVELFVTFFSLTGSDATMPVMSDVHNTLALGRVIYTDYIY